MEIKNNPLLINNYINIYDDVLPKNVLKKLYEVCENKKEFGNAYVVQDNEQKKDKEIRNTTIWHLKNLDENSLTTIHWANFFLNTFYKYINKYQENTKTVGSVTIDDIQLLKYTEGGHYVFHIDHARPIPRTLSCIFFINDNYEGGDLIFETPDKSHNLKIDRVANRMIIWPSNFLYPHCVTPVKKGTRYSVVSWAL
jgi:predicted 2-oxoglutarate/Fe(II)-dependent dioxygenase YbiX|tara:strand:+ start:2060 stop:2650 length:591 start_codon:yes stop_codon:yes gene_type:complete